MQGGSKFTRKMLCTQSLPQSEWILKSAHNPMRYPLSTQPKLQTPTMIFTVVQTTSFFEEGLQMELLPRTCAQLQIEGAFAIDIGEFYDDNWD